MGQPPRAPGDHRGRLRASPRRRSPVSTGRATCSRVLGAAADDPWFADRRRRARRARARHRGPAGHRRSRRSAGRSSPSARRGQPAVGALLDWGRAAHPRPRRPTSRTALWPLAGAEGWDAPGLLVGRSRAPRSARIHLAVDAVLDTVDEAVELGAQLLLVHHPLLLRGVTSVAEDRYKGAVIARLIRGGCALLAAHTNADIVARRHLRRARRRGSASSTSVPIVPSAADHDLGLGRVGDLAAADDARRARARRSPSVLPATAQGVRVAGEYDRAGARRSPSAPGRATRCSRTRRSSAADVYITSDLRHHPASEARENARVGRRPRAASTSRTGRANGSGSMSRPSSCAPPFPASRSR